VRSLAAAVLLLLTGCPPAATEVRPAPSASQAKIFVTADLRGYLGPCGCSENMRGGIARTAYQIAQARSGDAPVFFVDSGDALFGASTIPPEAVLQQERKAKALAETFKLMGLQTRAVGPLDDARGPAFREALKLPELPQSQLQVFELGTAKWAVVNAATVDELPARAAAARSQGAKFVLGLVQQPFEVVSKAAANGLAGVSLAIATRAKDELSGEQSRLVRSTTPVAQVQSKGRSLLSLELTRAGGDEPFELIHGAMEQEREVAALDQRIEMLRTQVNEPMLGDELKALRKGKLEEIIARREKLASTPLPQPEGKNVFSVRFIPLESNFPQAPEAVSIVTAYDRDVGELNLQWAKEHGKDCPAPEKGQPGFTGNTACLDCHEDAFGIWKTSKHAASYPTLQRVGKNYHLDCIGCHVTGWQKPGGTCRIDHTANREYVGCESCHGPGSVHAADPSASNIAKGNDAKVCTGCHDHENSPSFDFDAYVTKIVGPGHGQPAPKK
jgi:hypothetical protein